MSKSYREWTPTQRYLLPPSPSEWLSANHLVYFLLDLGEQLDVSGIESKYQAKDARGERPYDPRMMTLLLLYGYAVGMASSRKLERATYEIVPVRVLCAEEHPDHTRISEFRRAHLKELTRLFVQVLRLCQKAKLVKLGHVSLDGTKVKASASKHKAMSHERMQKTEAELEKEVRELLRRAEEADRDDDERHGKGNRGDDIPSELGRREERLRRIREAKAELEAEAAAARARELAERAAEAEEKAEEAEGEELASAEKKAERNRSEYAAMDERARELAQSAGMPEPDTTPRPLTELPSHQVPHTAAGAPTGKAQRNFTDAESRIMERGGEYLQGYNGQAVVDDAHQVIVAQAVTNQAPDAQHLPAMLAQAEANCGRAPRVMTADNGYWSEENARYCEERGVEAYIATGRLKHGETAPTVRGRPPADLDAKGRMRRRLATKKGRAIYARRKVIVEPVFGQTKQARGLRSFLLRGIDKVRGEWSLICTGHNLLKLYQAAQA